MKTYNKRGFSLVELLIVISIIVILAVIGITVNNNYTQNSKNSKITSDVSTIKNSLEAYSTETKKLPEPSGNKKYYNFDSSYAHHDDANIFGVYGNITQDTIPKKYLDFAPLDPRTNQFYAYGKTLSGSLKFQISGVNQIDGKYEAKVVGNHIGDEVGPYNLIREYNGPDFVYDLSKLNFPYNPEERVMRGKIGEFSGTVKVNNKIINQTDISSIELKSGDTIEVSVGGQATIYFSDGSKSYLGNQDNKSKLTIANIQYKEQDNLLTKIQLALDFGTIWTKTSKLDKNSDFEIYTNDIEAAVRGTIFKVEKINDSQTNVEVIKGKVDVYSITHESGLAEDIKNNKITRTTTQATQKVGNGANIPDTLEDNDGLENTFLFIKSIENGEVKIKLPAGFVLDNKKIWGNDREINCYDSCSEKINSYDINTGILTLDLVKNKKYEIKICDKQKIKCTKSLTVDTNILAFDEDKILEQPKEKTEEEICEDSGNVYFGSGGCLKQDIDGYELVAYAPYDNNGDLNMYKKGGDTITSSSGGDITFNDSDINNKGIEINSGDWLAYNGSELGLGSEFAIEMSISKEALEKIGGRFIFDNNSNEGLAISKNINSEFKIKYKKYLLQNNIPLNFNNNFETIILKLDGSNSKLQIGGEIFDITNTINIEDLFIGSRYDKIGQIDGVIDYVKIYKK